MTYEEAKVQLTKTGYLDREGDLSQGEYGYVYWHQGDEIILDGEFTVLELEAIVTYVKGTPRHAK